MVAASKPDTSKLYNELSKLYENGYDLLVKYKKLSKSFSDKKKNLSPSHENLEKTKKKINQELKNYLDSLEEVHKKKNSNDDLRKKAIYQVQVIDKVKLLRAELAALNDRMKTEKNNSNQYLLHNEKLFLKSKEILRAKKIDLLDKINRVKLLLKKQLKERFNNYMYSNFDTRVFGDDPDYQNYTGKDIIKFLKSGPISEKAAKKSKQINDLYSLKNVSDRKAQMELQIELVKLGDVQKKYKEYENLFINKIKKIINDEDDDMMKSRLFTVKNNKVVIKPTELNEFLNSTTEKSIYQKEIDNYNLKVQKLENKHKMLHRKIAKLQNSGTD